MFLMAFPHYTTVYHDSPYPSIDPTRPELSTTGKVVFITGGGSGLGPHLVHTFAKSGAVKIAIIGRPKQPSFPQRKSSCFDIHASWFLHLQRTFQTRKYLMLPSHQPGINPAPWISSSPMHGIYWIFCPSPQFPSMSSPKVSM